MFEYKPTKEVKTALENYNVKIKLLEEAEKNVEVTDFQVIKADNDNEAAINHMVEVRADTEKEFAKYDAIFHRDLTSQMIKYIEKIEKDNEQFLKNIQEMGSRIVLLKAKLNERGIIADHFLKENKKNENQNGELSQENVVLRNLISEKDAEIRDVREQLFQLYLQNDRLYKENEAIKDSRDAKIQNLEEEKRNLCTENSILRSRANLYLQDTVRLEKVINECTSRNNELEKMVLQMMEERNSLLRANAALKGETKEMVEQLAKNEETIKSLSLIKNSIF